MTTTGKPLPRETSTSSTNILARPNSSAGAGDVLLMVGEILMATMHVIGFAML
jgi:hypothetical protein